TFIFILKGAADLMQLLLVAASVLLLASGLSAQDVATEELRKKVESLQTEVEHLKAEGADAQHLGELERRIDLLAAELERSRTGGATEVEAPKKGEPGLGPAASKIYGRARGVSIGGYGEAIYDNVAARAQDGTPSGLQDRVDMLRFVLYTG